MDRTAKFNIGERVIHQRQGYRAIIVDVDPIFQASGRYNALAAEKDFASRNPWYRLLVDGSSLLTYVEECLLEKDLSPLEITNPLLGFYLKKRGDQYQRTNPPH